MEHDVVVDDRERWLEKALADAPPLTPQQLAFVRRVLTSTDG
jgi:hypothetical protein